jgi:chromosome segregation ATPase
MAFNNLSSDKMTQILLIVTLSLSSYSTLTNTQLDTSMSLISDKLDQKLDAIVALRVELNDKIDKALSDINSKVNYNSVELKIIENRLAEVEDNNNVIENKIESMQERLTRVESRITP